MDIRVKYNELDDVINSINVNATSLDEQINLMNDNINALKEAWQGYDADNFYNSIIPFTEELKSIPNFYRELTSVSTNMNKTYQEVDESFTEELKKSVVPHE